MIINNSNSNKTFVGLWSNSGEIKVYDAPYLQFVQITLHYLLIKMNSNKLLCVIPSGKIAEKAVCRSVFYALLQTVFLAILPTGYECDNKYLLIF